MSGTNGTGVMNFIFDGYTRRGYIEPIARLYNELRFSFRPVLTQQRAVIYDKVKKSPPAASEKVAAEVVRSQVVEWSLSDQKGDVVSITVDNALRMHPKLLEKLFLIVMGDVPPDVDPKDDSSSENDSDRDYRLAVAGAGPEAFEQDAEKN